MLIERNRNGDICRLTVGTHVFEVGVRVVASGTLAPIPKGVTGLIIEIRFPYQNNANDDVIVVEWDGFEGRFTQKAEDLMFIENMEVYPYSKFIYH